MPTKYKLYTVEEDGKTFHEEFYTKKQLLRYKMKNDEEVSLFECAERMVFAFNRGTKSKRGFTENKRYAYKLEKVTVQVLGSEAYYGLNISSSMCEAEFK